MTIKGFSWSYKPQYCHYYEIQTNLYYTSLIIVKCEVRVVLFIYLLTDVFWGPSTTNIEPFIFVKSSCSCGEDWFLCWFFKPSFLEAFLSLISGLLDVLFEFCRRRMLLLDRRYADLSSWAANLLDAELSGVEDRLCP